MAHSAPRPEPRDPARYPRPPAYAWAWLQRSRPVLAEVAQRLTGAPPAPDFVEHLRDRFTEDPFVQDVLAGVIAEVAFRGRVPSRRPPGASWDRGLTWWAATLAGTTLAAFEGREGDEAQRPLFDPAPGLDSHGADEATVVAFPGTEQALRQYRSPERAALVHELRGLLAYGEQVPAEAVRDLLARLGD